MKKIKINLSVKLIAIVIVGVLLVFTSFGAFRLYMEKNSLLEQMNLSGQERAALISDSVANLIIAYDYSNIESLLERMVKLQDVDRIMVFNRSGKLMVRKISNDYRDDKKGLVFTAPVNFSGKEVGRVELLISLDRYYQSIRKIYKNVIAAVSFATLFFVVLIYLTVSKFIVKPLSRLSKAAEQLALGNFSAELPSVTRDEMGVLVHTFASMRESRKLNEARLKTVIDLSPDAFIQLDSNGNITDWNDKAVSIWGFVKNEVVGKNFSVVLPPGELGLNPSYRQCYQKSENILGVIREVVGQRKDGTLFPLELRTSEISFEEGTAFLVSARDITERKESESKLLDAMNAAEAANAAKSAFLSNMSHEIRTPMNSIIGMSKLALKTHLNAKQHDYLNKIDYSANHLLGLINDILDFSKIEANKLEMESTDFLLGEIFKGLAGQLGHSAAGKGLHLVFELDDKLSIPLRGDPVRLSQVLLNYISNAIKFTDDGEIVVKAALLEDRASSVFIHCEVQDKGIGLSKPEIDKLFQPFHQTDASTTRKYGGTGLGLAICKQLVELMGGTVGVDSQPGQGSTFWFNVGFLKGSGLSTIAEASTQPDFELLKGASILLVEDNPFNQQVAEELLQDVGAKVVIANNGQEALDILREKQFNCVLMDVQMPVMDGLEATRRIRADPALAATCIVAMTANAGLEDRERCFAAGMDNFISKPVFSDNLYTVVAQCLGAAQTNRLPIRDKRIELVSASRMEKQTVQVREESIRSSAVIDLSVLGKMLGSDPAKIRKFSLKFLQSARQGLEEIDEAILKEDTALLAALGHRNKSPAKTVGAHAYAELCLSLEHFKKGGDIAQARQIVTQMHNLMDEISVEIEKEASV